MPTTSPVLVGVLFIGTQNFVGIRMGVVEPPFAIVDRVGEVEIRQHGPRMAAEAWLYDPPWRVPALRRNGIAVPVAPRDPG